MNYEKAIIFGADGYIGSALYSKFKDLGVQVFGTSRRGASNFDFFDVENYDLGSLEGELFDATHGYICFGITNILSCEKQKEMSRKINFQNTVSLASLLQKRGVLPVLFSTDYVFDGVDGMYSEESLTCPLNEYGRQKEDLQNWLLNESEGPFLLIRPSKVYDLNRGSKTLLDEMARTLISGQVVKAARDQFFSPILLDDFVDGVLALQKNRSAGIFNLCGSERTNRLELAQKIAGALGRDESQVRSISLEDLNEPFLRPKDTSMDNSKFMSLFKMKLNGLSNSIETLVRKYRSRENE